MKTTIAILIVLLLRVSGGFYYDHMTLTQKNNDLIVSLTKAQIASTKQGETIKSILSCANNTEKLCTQTKEYSSVLNCIKTKLSI